LDSTGHYRCKACNKMCDGIHENTAEHHKRLANYLWNLEEETREYPAPSQTWLAWVADPDFDDRRFLKCLLCKKWVQDFELDSLDTRGYTGHHGDRGAGNQKDHAKKLNNLSFYVEAIKAEKDLHHPPEPTIDSLFSASAPWAMRPPCSSASTAICPPASAARPEVRSAEPGLRAVQPGVGPGHLAQRQAQPQLRAEQPLYASLQQLHAGGPPTPPPLPMALLAGNASRQAPGSERMAASHGSPWPAAGGSDYAEGGILHASSVVAAVGPMGHVPRKPQGLPPGWRSTCDHDSGEYYFYHADGRVQWDPPCDDLVEV